MSASCLIALLLSATFHISHAADRVDSGTLSGKFIVGYQGWFGCPGDVGDNHDWQHWFLQGVGPETLTVDMLPVVKNFESKDLCNTGLTQPDGSILYLYSAQNPRIVAAHFLWMRQHGIDGAAVQRFIANMEHQRTPRFDNVLNNERAAAEASGTVFFVTYDISGGNPNTVVDSVRSDWRHLVRDLRVTDSPSYLRDHGKPVVELWGFGFTNRPGQPQDVAELIADLKGGRNELQAATVIGGVPTNWRTGDADSKRGPAWAAVYRSYDVISPWTPGRFSGEVGADNYLRDHVLADLAETRRLGIQYMPVIFPGISMSNSQRVHAKNTSYPMNKIPRNCGKFYWRQVSNLLDQHVTMLYGAMFDEVDEATAIYPVIARAAEVLNGAKMVTLDIDGCALPEDYYLRIAEKAAGYLHAQKSPPKNLDVAMRP
jgi:hypothetical protein